MSFTTITLNTIDYVSYASVAEADARLAVDPVRSAAWLALTDDAKGINLVAATNRLDYERYSGTKEVNSQENKWPRIGATCNSTAIPDGDIPLELEKATILLAGTIAITPTASSAGSASSNIKRAKAGSAEVEFFRPTGANFSIAKQSPDVFALIKCLLEGASSGGPGSGFASGTTGTSSFDNENSPDLNRGYS